MKILCQERYDKAVAYAKEIKNDTLQKCIDRLKQGKKIPIAHVRLNSTMTLHLTHSDSDRYIQMVEQELSEACSITDSRPIVCCIVESYSRVDYTHIKKKSRKGASHSPFRDLLVV